MKLRTMGMVLLAASALAGCKKKAKEQKAPDMGTNTMSGTGAGTGAGTATEPPKEAKLEGKALADKYVECATLLSSADKITDFQTKCIAKDYKGHEADGQDLDLAKATEFFKTQFTAFPDTKFAPQLALVNGRNVYGVLLVTGTHKGPMKTPMGEVPPTDKKIGNLMFHRLVIDDENRAKEEMAYADPSTLMSQLGLMPKEAPQMRPAMDKGWDGAPVIVVAADDEKEKKNLEVVQNANKAFQGKKPAEYMAFYTDDAIESDQAGEKDMKGKKEIEAGSQIFLKAFPDLKLETTHIAAAGDYVVLTGTFSGTNTGPLGPMKPTKKPVKGEYAEVFKLKDGKISHVWRFRNGMAMAAQLGLIPEPKPTGDAPKGGEPAKKDEPKKG